MVPVIAVG